MESREPVFPGDLDGKGGYCFCTDVSLVCKRRAPDPPIAASARCLQGEKTKATRRLGTSTSIGQDGKDRQELLRCLGVCRNPGRLDYVPAGARPSQRRRPTARGRTRFSSGRSATN